MLEYAELSLRVALHAFIFNWIFAGWFLEEDRIIRPVYITQLKPLMAPRRGGLLFLSGNYGLPYRFRGFNNL